MNKDIKLLGLIEDFKYLKDDWNGEIIEEIVHCYKFKVRHFMV